MSKQFDALLLRILDPPARGGGAAAGAHECREEAGEEDVYAKEAEGVQEEREHRGGGISIRGGGGRTQRHSANVMMAASPLGRSMQDYRSAMELGAAREGQGVCGVCVWVWVWVCAACEFVCLCVGMCVCGSV
jgi:hypothetical protein